MYCEDADLCIRAKKAGARLLICPDATVIHHGGASERVREDKLVRLFTAKARLFKKHWGPLRATLGISLLSLYPLTRMTFLWGLRWLGTSEMESYRTWLAIWRRRCDWSGIQAC
jgi:hypothetical protein